MSGVRISDLRNNSRPLEIDVFGTKITFDYKPMVLTWDEENDFLNRWQAESDKLEKAKAGEKAPTATEESKEEEESTFQYLERLVGRWDLTEDVDDGMGGKREVPVPILASDMHRIPPIVTMSMFVAIGKDRSPNLKSGSNSGEPSSTQTEEEGSLTGS